MGIYHFEWLRASDTSCMLAARRDVYRSTRPHGDDLLVETYLANAGHDVESLLIVMNLGYPEFPYEILGDAKAEPS
jgi:hypothetical protein